MSRPNLRRPLRSPSSCGIQVKALERGGVALLLVESSNNRILGRGIMTAVERRALGTALLDDGRWEVLER
jgi:hypothetical protein